MNRRREKTHITKIYDVKGNITTDSTEMQNIIIETTLKIYTPTKQKISKTFTSFQRYDPPQLNLEDIHTQFEQNNFKQ